MSSNNESAAIWPPDFSAITSLSLFEKIRYGIEAAIVIFVLAWAWNWVLSVPPVPVGITVEATPAPEVKDISTVDVPTKSVRVYAPKAKKELKLPDRIQKDAAVAVIASSKIKADTHGSTVTTVINTETGKSETVVRRDPLDWLAFKTSGRVGVYAGVSNHGTAAMLRAEQDFLSIKALNLSVTGTVIQPTSDADTTGFVGLGGRLEW